MPRDLAAPSPSPDAASHAVPPAAPPPSPDAPSHAAPPPSPLPVAQPPPKAPAAPPGAAGVRVAIYTRKSSAAGLHQDFNSLDAQREACERHVRGLAYAGWQLVPERYDDGGFTGANLERPAFRRLMDEVDAGRVGAVVVYKVDRLSRSLLDFARVMERFTKAGADFVSVTQNFNTADAMGRLTLNMLMSLRSPARTGVSASRRHRVASQGGGPEAGLGGPAEEPTTKDRDARAREAPRTAGGGLRFEREMIAERTRDKVHAARRRGKWVGGIRGALVPPHRAEHRDVLRMLKNPGDVGS